MTYTQTPLIAGERSGPYIAVTDTGHFRRDLNVIFAALIIHTTSFLFSWFISEALAGALSALFPSEGAYYAVYYAAESITYALEYFIPALLIMFFAHISPLRLAALPEGGRTMSAARKTNIFFAVCVGLCAVEAAALISGWVMDIFGSMGFDFYIGLDEDLPADAGGIIFYFVSISVVPGIVEELLFRGCVLGVMKRYNAVYAIILSSVLFGAMHCTVQQFFYAFCAGLVFGWIAYSTGRLWPGMLIHMLNNALSVLFDYMYTLLDYDLYAVLYLSISMTILVLGIIGLIMMIRRGGRISESVSEVDLKTAMRMTARPLPILYILIIIAITVLVLSV